MRNGENGARSLRGGDEVLEGEGGLGDVGATSRSQPVDEDSRPGLGRALADDLGVQLEHRRGEVGPTDALGIGGARAHVLEGQSLEAQFAQSLHQAGVSLGAFVAQARQELLDRVLLVEGQEVRQDVHATRDGLALGSLARESGVEQGYLNPRDQFEVVAGAGIGHLVVAGGGVVISQGDGAQPQIVGVGGQVGRGNPSRQRNSNGCADRSRCQRNDAVSLR